MKSNINVPIPTDTFLGLIEFLRDKRDPRDPVQVIWTAIDYWLDNASWKPELMTESDARGYQWKNLFLPDATQLRMQYKSQYFYARVEGDRIIYKGKPISPGSLANEVTGTSRNAWRDLWIKRPQDQGWKLADDCRPKQPPAADELLKELAGNANEANPKA